MKAIVTGGAGFIGSHLVDALVARGDGVTVVDDLSRGRREQIAPGAELVVADVASEDAAACIARVRPDVIFHLAAQIDVRRSVREPLYDTHVNVTGTVNLLQAAVEAGTRRFVLASSGGTVYGDAAVVPTPEDAPLAPTSQYGAAKASAEIYLHMYGRLRGIEGVALRYANVYGPRQDPHGEAGVVAIFHERLLRGEQAFINGDGLQSRDYVYVADVVAANLAAVDGPPGDYNVGTGVETDVNSLYDLIAAVCDSSAEARHREAQPGEQRRSCLDIGRARRALGWSPAHTLEAGLRLTADYFRAASASV